MICPFNLFMLFIISVDSLLSVDFMSSVLLPFVTLLLVVVDELVINDGSSVISHFFFFSLSIILTQIQTNRTFLNCNTLARALSFEILLLFFSFQFSFFSLSLF